MRSHAPLPALVLAAGLSVQLLSATSARAESFVRGDADLSREVELTDAVVIVNALFLGRGQLVCRDAADSNDDGSVDVTDPTYLLNYLFRGGPIIPPPFPEAGDDPTEDALPCESCGGRPEQSPAALCGPDGAACGLEESVLIQEGIGFRNGAPSIALRAGGLPHALFPLGTDMYYGSRDAAGNWTVAPMTAAESGETIQGFHGTLAPHESPPRALVAGFGALEVWQREADGGWRLEERLTEARLSQQRSVASDGTGCLRAGVYLSGTDDVLGLATDSDRWTVESVPHEEPPPEIGLSLNKAGLPRIAVWATGEAGWELRVGNDTGTFSTVVPVNSFELGQHRNINFATLGSGADEQAHFLVNVSRDSVAEEPFPEGRLALEAVVGSPESGWKRHELGLHSPRFEDPSFCFEAPPVDGAECPFDFTSYHSLAVVENRAGDVRFLFSRVRRFGKAVAVCPDPFDVASCSIENEFTYDADLRIAWLDGDSVEQRVLVKGVVIQQARAAFGVDGSLQVIGFEQASGPSQVRYLRFAP